MNEVYADAGYLSSNNAQAIAARGATPFIKPRSNTRGRPKPREKDKPAERTSEPFRTMIDRYHQDKASWMRAYAKRNSIESTWSSVKRRFNSSVTALSSRMRRVEAALKLLVWNITRVTRT